MNILEKRGTLKRYPRISAPLQVVLCGVFLTFATPAACALFPQQASISVSKLEPHVQVCFTTNARYFYSNVILFRPRLTNSQIHQL